MFFSPVAYVRCGKDQLYRPGVSEKLEYGIVILGGVCIWCSHKIAGRSVKVKRRIPFRIRQKVVHLICHKGTQLGVVERAGDRGPTDAAGNPLYLFMA